MVALFNVCWFATALLWLTWVDQAPVILGPYSCSMLIIGAILDTLHLAVHWILRPHKRVSVHRFWLPVCLLVDWFKVVFILFFKMKRVREEIVVEPFDEVCIFVLLRLAQKHHYVLLPIWVEIPHIGKLLKLLFTWNSFFLKAFGFIIFINTHYAVSPVHLLLERRDRRVISELFNNLRKRLVILSRPSDSRILILTLLVIIFKLRHFLLEHINRNVLPLRWPSFPCGIELHIKSIWLRLNFNR